MNTIVHERPFQVKFKSKKSSFKCLPILSLSLRAVSGVVVDQEHNWSCFPLSRDN